MKVEDASKHFTGVNDVETIVTAQRHNHPGGAYSFRIERNGKVLVICTDVEHGEQIDPRVVELAAARICWCMTRNTRRRNCETPRMGPQQL